MYFDKVNNIITVSIKQELNYEISRFKTSVHTQRTGSYHNLYICKHPSKYFADDSFRVNKSSRNHINNLSALDDIHGLLIHVLIIQCIKILYVVVNFIKILSNYADGQFCV